MTGDDTPEDQDRQQDDEDQSDGPKHGFAAILEEKKQSYPDVGYHLVEIDELKPPGKMLTPLTHTHKLKLSEMEMRPETNLTDYVIYDQHGHDYAQRTFEDLNEPPPEEQVDELLETVRDGKERDRRIALAQLALLAESDQGACLDIIPTLVSPLEGADPAVQAEIVGILDHVADEDPDTLTGIVSKILPLLEPTRHPDLQTEVLSVLATVADHDALAVVDAAPKLAVLLEDEEEAENERQVLLVLMRIAEVHPDAVVPVAPELIWYADEGTPQQQVGALAALGYVAKAYPYVAEQTILTAKSLLAAENDKLRTNAAGLLADLATQHADDLRNVVPQAIDLLDDTGEKAQYNATSLLARVADEQPDAAEAATEGLIDVLDADMAYTRANACCALGYMKAESALEDLETLAADDPNEEVRQVASHVINLIDDGRD